jgi:hypothetical protein
MKKKSVLIALFLITSVIATSCGPKRYKCGPYRRCDVQFENNLPKINIPNSSISQSKNV